MLFDGRTLDGIAAGRVDLAFRRWERPRARAGGRQRTRIGVVAFDAVEVVDAATITDADARRAGLPDRGALVTMLDTRPGAVHRIRLRLEGPDPRVARREQAEVDDALLARLARLPWARPVLMLIAEHPGVRAPDLAASQGRETLPFKRDVRKLKELGLTESLPVGYRLSPRGEAALARLRADHP